jgi:hypothetical protein
VDSRIIEQWKIALKKELDRKFKSPYKKYHQNVIYDTVTDENKLNMLFKIKN